MEKFILRIALISSLLLAACSGSELESISGIDSNTVISGAFSERTSDKISGTGRIRFTEALPVGSRRSLSLKFSLDQAIVNSTVSAIFYSQDATVPLNKGVVITFSRSGASVAADVSINGSTSAVSSSRLVYYYPASLDLIIEVHNDASKARVLVWRRDQISYTPDTADIDTDRSGDISPSLPVSSGGGAFAGLDLTNATVTAAIIGSQKVLD